jgi:hypothetical protein
MTTISITKTKLYYKLFFFCLLMIAGYVSGGAPSVSAVEYRVSLDGVLDNREYHSPLTDQTLFFARGEMELGLVLDDHHKMRGGVTYMQEFGAPETSDNLHLLLYYHYDNGKNAKFHFGAFPRAGALELPKWFFGDEAAYYRPFIHGAVVEVDVPGGITLCAWVDWTGRQTATVKETFLFGYNVRFRQGIAFLKHDFMKYHQSYTRPRPTDQYAVWDNGGMSIEAGFLMENGRYLDMLLLSAGGIISLDRHRKGYDWYTGITYPNIPWHTPAGGFLNGEISRSIFVIKGFFYKGEMQRLYWGDDFYSYSGLGSYGWLDLGIRSNSRSYIGTELSQKFHFYGGKVGYSQHFLLKMELRNP